MPSPVNTPESFEDKSEAWRKKHAQQTCERLAGLGLWALPNVDLTGQYTGRIVLDPDQLIDLLNDLDLRTLEA